MTQPYSSWTDQDLYDEMAAKLTDAEAALADLLGAAALLSIGWRIRGRLVDHLRDWRLGHRAWGRN